jgi:hypothetical protein
MALGGDRFGLGINWLQRLASLDDDQGRGPLVSKPDLPPMFRPDRHLHSGGETVIESVEPLEDEDGSGKT